MRRFPRGQSRKDRLQALGDIDLNSAEPQRAIAFLKEHHTVVDPTIALFELFTATTAKPPASFEPGVLEGRAGTRPATDRVEPPTEMSQLGDKVFEKNLAIVGLTSCWNVPIVAGTDQAVPGYSLHREIELYVQAGFTPMEAIQSATIVPARAMGLDKEVRDCRSGQARGLGRSQRQPARRHSQYAQGCRGDLKRQNV